MRDDKTKHLWHDFQWTRPREGPPQTTSSPSLFLIDSRASETRARVKISPREKKRHAWGDYHARSRFAYSAIPEEKWGTTVTRSLRLPALAGILQVVKTSQVTSLQVVKMTVTTIACTEQWLFFRFFFQGECRQKRGEHVAQDTPDGGKHEHMITACTWTLTNVRLLHAGKLQASVIFPSLFFCISF